MKNMILILSMFFLITGCSEKETKQQETSIYGTWKLIQVYSNIGNGENSWNEVDVGYTYVMNIDNSFVSTKYNECSSRKFEIDNAKNTLSFIFDCLNFHPCVNQSNSCIEYFSFQGNKLILSASYQNCDESCPQFKFKKIPSE